MTNEELCTMYQQGTKEVIEDLYAQNAGMIEKIIRRYQGLEDLADLRQESYFGLVRAAELWDPNRGSFIGYAVYWIRAALTRYVENCGSVIRVPVNRRSQIGRYKRTVNEYQVRFGRDPSRRELCAALDLTREQLENLQRDALTIDVRSTAEQIGGEEDDITLEDTIAAAEDPAQDTIDKIQREELAAELWDCVDDLKPQQAAVIRDRYRNGHTLKECGEALGVSIERARQIEMNAIRELRKTRYMKRLRPYLTDQAAYSMGLKSTGLSSFKHNGSSQELAMIRLENITGMSLWTGKEL